MIVLALTVLLHWTAPGDDGSVGTAAEYDVRYAADSTVLRAWTTATQLPGEPAPKVAGSEESFQFTLPTGAWFIAIKTRDEAFNWSGLSNIVRVEPPDTIPPAPVLDLRTGP